VFADLVTAGAVGVIMAGRFPQRLAALPHIDHIQSDENGARSRTLSRDHAGDP